MAASPITIRDAEDARIAPFRAIREKDLVGRRGLFIAEGTVVLRVLAEAHAKDRFVADRILVLENRLAGIADVLSAFPEDVPVYVCEAAVMNAIAGFDMHRGVLALGRVAESPAASQLIAGLGETALVAVAIGLSNHDNAGALFRNATAFAADAVLLDATSCDPLYRKALRVSVGSVLKMPWSRGGSAEELLTALGAAGFQVVTLSPSGGTALNALPPAKRTALVLGTEGEGLPAPILEAFRPVRIPQSPGLDSLNVATAAGIALYQLALSTGRIG
ncbi:TrmH family RNA methyltransferase [Martelella radicis]|uniref:tRNA G18 (Ribose-2'-O)-methylase SpoU n=1 Tax=Martelella radicis TaxID=1397476 RepID=A0A7W6KGK6_9HYPH|nr:RNA methyltransferase [Martelella radicis]MBB4120841.1 tRNA G18 (ribose-2'-O)-methylase SpoU [Martelella radicis]